MEYTLELYELAPTGESFLLGTVKIDEENVKVGTVIKLPKTLVRIIEIDEQSEGFAEAVVECVNPGDSFFKVIID